MSNPNDLLENLWDQLLSREPDTICSAYHHLSIADQSAVKAHLMRMATEPGWHPEQVISARIALQSIERKI